MRAAGAAARAACTGDGDVDEVDARSLELLDGLEGVGGRGALDLDEEQAAALHPGDLRSSALEGVLSRTLPITVVLGRRG